MRLTGSGTLGNPLSISGVALRIYLFELLQVTGHCRLGLFVAQDRNFERELTRIMIKV